MVTGCRAIFVTAGCIVSSIGVEAVGGGVQGAGQVAGDGRQAVVYLTHLALGGLEFIPGFDTGQGYAMALGLGADVLPPP
jgi:hypothetical protein